MQSFLVIWRGADEVIQSEVKLADNCDASKLTPQEWVAAAAASEGGGIDSDAAPDFTEPFDLYAVIRGPVEFIY